MKYFYFIFVTQHACSLVMYPDTLSNNFCVYIAYIFYIILSLSKVHQYKKLLITQPLEETFINIFILYIVARGAKRAWVLVTNQVVIALRMMKWCDGENAMYNVHIFFTLLRVCQGISIFCTAHYSMRDSDPILMLIILLANSV
jgi:hypothetical protein